MWRISFRYIIVHTKIFVFRYLMSACQGFVAFFLLWTNSIITFCYHPKLTPFYTQFPFQFIWTCRIFYLISIIFCACMSICQIYICEQSFILNKTVFFSQGSAAARQPSAKPQGNQTFTLFKINWKSKLGQNMAIPLFNKISKHSNVCKFKACFLIPIK